MNIEDRLRELRRLAREFGLRNAEWNFGTIHDALLFTPGPLNYEQQGVVLEALRLVEREGCDSDLSDRLDEMLEDGGLMTTPYVPGLFGDEVEA